jgi:hypothetical protein
LNVQMKLALQGAYINPVSFRKTAIEFIDLMKINYPDALPSSSHRPVSSL